MNRYVSWSAVLLVAAAVAVTAFSGYLIATWPPDPPSAAAPVSQTSDGETDSDTGSAPQPTADQDVMVVLGDSISVESNVSDGPEWPQLVGKALGMKVVLEAADRSGYISPGRGEPYGDRVDAVLKEDPDVIVVAGGVGDVGAYPTARIATAAEDVVSQLVDGAPDAQVVVVSPFSNGDPGPFTLEFSSRLKEIAKQQDVPYVNATTWLPMGQGYFGADIYHPTDEGQRQVADRMEAALSDLGIAEDGTGASAP